MVISALFSPSNTWSSVTSSPLLSCLRNSLAFFTGVVVLSMKQRSIDSRVRPAVSGRKTTFHRLDVSLVDAPQARALTIDERNKYKIATCKNEVYTPANIGDGHWHDLDDHKCREPKTGRCETFSFSTVSERHDLRTVDLLIVRYFWSRPLNAGLPICHP